MIEKRLNEQASGKLNNKRTDHHKHEEGKKRSSEHNIKKSDF